MSYSVLVIDDDERARKAICDFLRLSKLEVLEGATLKDARESIKQNTSDIILLDVQLPDGYGPNLLKEIKSDPNAPMVIMITAHGDIEMAVDAMQNGAHDFIQKPIEDNTRLLSSIQRAGEIIRLRREVSHIRQTQNQAEGFVIGTSIKMRTIVEQAKRAADASVSVLITGETGSGKEVLANYIHRNGPRAKKPYFPENCSAIQPTMIEAELFGFEAHAFTSADKKKIGLMEVVDTGILFLDEIASVAPDVQAKLLRAIENQTFRRVGGIAQIHVDVQVIAASNRDLKVMIREGKFREDLYYRLKVVDLHIPPLRERKEDIPELTGYFIRTLNPKMGKNVLGITPRALQALQNYEWPGNIREISNAIERALIFCNGETIDISDLPVDVVENSK
jgi:two-component system, NtrC family, response regulator AtoC